jgi:hypothetical protein
MTEKINQHRPIPAGAPEVRHNSGGMRSTPAGGQVPREQYETPTPPTQK